MTIQRVFYGPREVAEILGVSKKHIYGLLKSGKLPHIRVGRLIRVSLADIKALRGTYDENGVVWTDETSVKHRAALVAHFERKRAEKEAAAAREAGDVE